MGRFGRQKASTRHKVDRKKKEAKRDIRKAAKAMKAAGMANDRKKKARESAKSALRMSKASANKEAALNQLLKVREHMKLNKLERRAERKRALKEGRIPATLTGTAAAQAAANKLMEKEAARRGVKRNRDDEDDEEDEEDWEDVDEEEEDEEEEFDEEEEDAEAEAAAAPKKGNTATQKHRQFIPNKIAAHPHEQFRKFLDIGVFPQLDTDSADELPDGWEPPHFALPATILFTVDARCAVQSTPWGELDYLMTLASEAYDQSKEMEEALAFQKKQQAEHKAKLAAAGKKQSKKEKLLELEDEQGETLVKPYVKPLVLFVLTKCDLVAATTIAAQYKLLSDTLYAKYGYELPAEGDDEETAVAKKASGERRLLSKEEIPVEIAFAPFSHEVEGTTRQVMRILREYGTTYHQAVKETYPEDKNLISHNLPNGKVAVALYGLPKTGKSSLLRAMCTIGTDSAVAVAPCNRLFIQASAADPNADVEDENADLTIMTRLLVPSPKQINVVTFPDDQTFNKNALIGGDVVFYGSTTLEKLETPEAAATLLLSQIPDKELVAQNFSVALPGSGKGGLDSKSESGDVQAEDKLAMSILKSLGRSIIRERGFLPSVYAGATDETTPGTFGTPSVLSASGVKDANFTAINGRRVVRVWPKKQDQKNAIRVGARTFLKEFTTSAHFPWAVTTSADKSIRLENYQYPCVFCNKYFSKKDFGGEIPDEVIAEIEGKASVASSANKGKNKNVQQENAATFGPGLTALQQAMMAYLVLLPKIAIPVDPMSIVPHQYDFFLSEKLADENASLGHLANGDFDDEEDDEEMSLGSLEEGEFDEDEDEEEEGNPFVDDEAEEGEEFSGEELEEDDEDEEEDEEAEW